MQIPQTHIYYYTFYYYYVLQNESSVTNQQDTGPVTSIKQYIPPKPEYEYDMPNQYEYIYYYVLFNKTTSSVPPKQDYDPEIPVDPPTGIISSTGRPKATLPTVEETTGPKPEPDLEPKPEPEPEPEPEPKPEQKPKPYRDYSEDFTPKTPSKDCNVCCRRFISYRCRC